MEGQIEDLDVLEERAAEAIAAFERARAARGGGGGGGGAGRAEQAVECNGCVMLFGRASDVKRQFYPYAGGTQLPANWVSRLRAAGAIVGARAAGADN